MHNSEAKDSKPLRLQLHEVHKATAQEWSPGTGCWVLDSDALPERRVLGGILEGFQSPEYLVIWSSTGQM